MQCCCSIVILSLRPHINHILSSQSLELRARAGYYLLDYTSHTIARQRANMRITGTIPCPGAGQSVIPWANTPGGLCCLLSEIDNEVLPRPRQHLPWALSKSYSSRAGLDLTSSACCIMPCRAACEAPSMCAVKACKHTEHSAVTSGSICTVHSSLFRVACVGCRAYA